ncbi:MAG TPA: LacI family DNA-binding transcriptional regulator [Gaiellaceae bacterium]|nr:LacI family DNA-binding transcriptional regulator [Gaiellaceae bacterium]
MAAVTLESPPVAASPQPVTLVDLAREAGTSPSTASRALSGRGYVSAPVRERLLEAANRLGYVPNASARTLKHRTSRAIGVVVSDLANPFYARLAAGIEQVLREAGHQMVVLGDNSELDAEVAGARTFLAMRAPGVIMTPAGAEAGELLISQGVAVVEVDRRLVRVPCDAVVIDNERGAAHATEHLLGLGHRRIAFLGVETDWTTDVGRLEGYRKALARAGVPPDEDLVLRIPLHVPDIPERIEGLLDRAGATAVFAANNLLTEEAWRVIRRRGLRIPEDVSLVGFDDVPWMEMVDPPLTVVAQPILDLGRHAARLLLRRLAAPSPVSSVEILQPSLVIRGSTGRRS